MGASCTFAWKLLLWSNFTNVSFGYAGQIEDFFFFFFHMIEILVKGILCKTLLSWGEKYLFWNAVHNYYVTATFCIVEDHLDIYVVDGAKISKCPHKKIHCTISIIIHVSVVFKPFFIYLLQAKRTYLFNSFLFLLHILYIRSIYIRMFSVFWKHKISFCIYILYA